MLKDFALKEGVPLILGTNYSSESILPRVWSQGHMDWGYIKKVNKLFGTKKLKDFPHYSVYKRIYWNRIKGLRIFSLLDYIDYDKEKAKKFLIEVLNWRDYGGKHHESIYTKFFQGYILPTKFGFDKRRAHLSSLILAGQITRDEAINEMKKPLYDDKELQEHLVYIPKKLGSVFKRDRAVVISGLVGISVAGWAYMVVGMGATCPHTSMHGMHSWEAADFILTFIMWTIMMVAMMVPSVAPTVLMFATICRKRHETQEAVVPAGLFLLGYLVAWTWYSALATLGQWSLWIAAFSPSIDFDPSLFGGGLLLATGIFLFTPLKYACLARCRSPLGFFLKEWREGSWGAFMMGLRSGNFCVICCWALFYY